MVAGLAGGSSLVVAMKLTFRALGFGWKGNGILFDPRLQSPILIAVWIELNPLAEAFTVAAVCEVRRPRVSR